MRKEVAEGPETDAKKGLGGGGLRHRALSSWGPKDGKAEGQEAEHPQ